MWLPPSGQEGTWQGWADDVGGSSRPCPPSVSSTRYPPTPDTPAPGVLRVPGLQLHFHTHGHWRGTRALTGKSCLGEQILWFITDSLGPSFQHRICIWGLHINGLILMSVNPAFNSILIPFVNRLTSGSALNLALPSWIFPVGS